jgi:hypothetical protein
MLSLNLQVKRVSNCILWHTFLVLLSLLSATRTSPGDGGGDQESAEATSFAFMARIPS